MNRGARFLTNVLWSWAGVAATILVAILLPPSIIAKVGFKSYTVWLLALSFIDYFWLSDLGLRSATINFSARYWPQKDFARLSQVLACSLIFSFLMSGGILIGVTALAPVIARFFHLEDSAIFITLLRIVSACWAVMSICNAFSSCLEGCQRFDLSNRAWVISLIVRVVGIVAVIYTTGELEHMGWVMLAAQTLWCGLIIAMLRRNFPQVQINPRLANPQMFKAMWNYAIHTFIGGVSNFMLNKSILPMTARFLGPEAFGAYTLPRRILEYAMDGVGRIGMVTAPNATELYTQGDTRSLTELGVYTNRYSFAMFSIGAVYLLVFGQDLITLWLHSAPESAVFAASLLPAMLLGQTVAAGQFNSASLLFGMGRHQMYSRTLFMEGLVVILANWLLLPTYGLHAAVWTASAIMAINRGFVLNYLVTRELGVDPWRYARRIYARPLALAALGFVLLWTARRTIDVVTWTSAIAAAIVLLAAYFPLLLRYCVAPAHQQWIFSFVQRTSLPGWMKLAIQQTTLRT